MHSALTAEQAAFQREVERFLAQSLPRDIADCVRLGKSVGKQNLTRWHRILSERGWVAPNWPVVHGGTGWTLIERHLFDVACRAAHAPALSPFGLNMVGPAIIRFGTPEQQARFLPGILDASTWWCQGYSEPGAGSDLAAVATRAVRDGDSYVVSGQKIWTSGAEDADWIFCLTRTDPQVQPQRGISFLLIDMRSPGVRVQPLYAFNGKRLWNQVFFEEVRVPAENRLGAEHAGWTVAKSLLGDERLFVSRVAENKRMLTLLNDIAATVDADDDVREALRALEIRLMALEQTSLRMLTSADAGGSIGAEPSMLKLKGSELVQAMDTALFELAGYFALPADDAAREPAGPDWCEMAASSRYHHRGYTIAGGTSEVQHNIIAKAVLGL